MNLSDLKTYLPKFLSEDSERALIKAIREFPDIIGRSYYTNKLSEENTIYQGDGIADLLIVDLPNTNTKKAKAIVLSNTCDIDPNNKRYFPSRIIYAPITPLASYEKILNQEGKKPEQITTHFKAIKNQEITQIFYLPTLDHAIEESIVFLDRIYNLPNNYVSRENLKSLRLFTLSDFGSYLFLFKISIHFTRVQDKVDRGYNL